jgi:HD superfamily phosphodiesterase
MILQQRWNELEEFAHSHMPPDILHGWPHVKRVLYYAGCVNNEIQGNWDIIRSACLLHDIGHSIQRENHHEISARIAGDFLVSIGIPGNTGEHIQACILTHSRQYSREVPHSIEAQVVFDADGMDLFGPIGLMRALLACGLRGKGFDCMIKKLTWRLGERENFYSKTALDFAQGNGDIIEQYLAQLQKQLRQMEE